jgi:hypothetical protein
VVRFALIALLAACRIDALDVTGKPCPCPSDWICETSTQTCQRASSEDAATDGTTDAGFDLATGLRYYFKFDQTSGQAIPDSSPMNRPGRAASAAQTMWIAGVRGNALHFTGDPYMAYAFFPTMNNVCTNPEQTMGSFTLSLWVKFDAFHTFNGYTLGDIAAMHGSSGGLEGGFGIGATDQCGTTTAGVTITTPANVRINRCGTSTLAVDTWHYLTGVYDATATTLDIYVNGVKENGALSTATPIPTSINTPAADVCMYLAASQNQNSLLYGSLDEFRLYHRALTPAEIAELYRVSQ